MVTKERRKNGWTNILVEQETKMELMQLKINLNLVTYNQVLRYLIQNERTKVLASSTKSKGGTYI